ncbi:hypothetical protein FOZ62_032230, partial [Perkinsus olseni]
HCRKQTLTADETQEEEVVSGSHRQTRAKIDRKTVWVHFVEHLLGLHGDSLGSGSRANRRVAAVVDEMFHWTPALLLGLVGDLLHPGVDMHIINRSPASPQIGFVLYSPKAAAVTKLPRASDGEEELTDEHCCIICLGTMKDPPTVEGCHHTFCSECLDAWLEKSDRCPVCSCPVTLLCRLLL